MGGNSFHLSLTEAANFERFVPAAQRAYWKAQLTSSVFIKPKVLTPYDKDCKILSNHAETAANRCKPPL
jgi:hypothetical protein